MQNGTLVKGLLSTVFLSTLMVACGNAEGTDSRAALDDRDEIETVLDANRAFVSEPGRIEVREAPERAEPPPRRAEPAAGSAEPVREQPQPSLERRPEPAEPPAPRTVTLTVAAGTSLAARLSSELSTETASAGDAFTASLSEAVRGDDGSVLIPAGAMVHGRVAESRASSRAGREAHIALAVSRVSFRGESHDVTASVMDPPTELVTRDSRGSQAAKVAGGAAAGAAIGQAIGRNTRSTVAGAAAGAAAGTAVAIGTANVDAVIPAGAPLTIRLDSSLEMEREM